MSEANSSVLEESIKSNTMNAILEITHAKKTWKIHVRVERLWITYSPYNPTDKRSIELILLDGKIVIAEVLNVGDIIELNKNGQGTKCVIVHLLDSISDTIKCTSWNTYADQMVNYWKNKDGPVCVILQYAMVKDFRLYYMSAEFHICDKNVDK
ncbi:hypothetical protein OROMI_006816 [Orobanche minor]